MPIPRNSTAQGDVILDDPTAYLNEVARRCKGLAIEASAFTRKET